MCTKIWETGCTNVHASAAVPGTVAVAAALQNKYNITTVPHILCSGFSREDTEYVLLDLQFLGITDLLVLRGDKAKHESAFVPENNGYNHAIEPGSADQ